QLLRCCLAASAADSAPWPLREMAMHFLRALFQLHDRANRLPSLSRRVCQTPYNPGHRNASASGPEIPPRERWPTDCSETAAARAPVRDAVRKTRPGPTLYPLRRVLAAEWQSSAACGSNLAPRRAPQCSTHPPLLVGTARRVASCPLRAWTPPRAAKMAA